MAIDPKKKVQAVDFAERVSATFVQAFIAIALVTGVNDKKGLEAAAVAGALAAGKYVYTKLNNFVAKSDAPAA